MRVALLVGKLKVEDSDAVASTLGFASSREWMQYVLYGNTTFAEHTPSFANQVRIAAACGRQEQSIGQRVENLLSQAIDYTENPTPENLADLRLLALAIGDDSEEFKESERTAWTGDEVLANAAERHRRNLQGRLPSSRPKSDG